MDSINNGIDTSPYKQKGQRSEEVVAIIEKMPMRFSRYVSGIVFLIAALLCLFGWLIRYPDLVKGQISISAPQSPVKLVTAIGGTLDLQRHHAGDTVYKGEYIAVLKNPALTSDVRRVDSLLNSLDIHRVSYNRDRHRFPENAALGEVSEKYYAFLTALYEYLDFYETDPIGQQEAIARTLMSSNIRLLTAARAQENILGRKYALAQRDFARDSNLFSKQVIDPSDMDKSRLTMITYEQDAQAVSKDIYNDQYQIEDASNKLDQLAVQRVDKERELTVALLSTYFQAKETIRQWEKSYVLMAPFDGKLEFLNFYKDGDFLPAGKEVFSVVPREKEIYGEVLLPEAGAGKVRVGQEVIIKLNNSPYEEYGTMKGVVYNISLVTNQQQADPSNPQNKVDVFLVTVALPQGLTTNYGSALNFYFEAKGSAEIVTKDRQLYQRLFDNLKQKTKQ
jgi:hypothetical protein